MANILGVITAIVLALAAFVAMKNKERYQAEIDNRKAEEEKLRKTERRLDIATKDKDKTIGERKAVEEEIVVATREKETLERTNSDLKSQSEAKGAKISENTAQLDEIRDKTAKFGDIKDLASKMKVTNDEINALKVSIDESQSKLNNLTAQTKATEESSDALQDKLTLLTSGRSLPTLRTTIRSIYPAWGFVTLGAGNNAGVVTNSTLNVVRDGQTIAKLVVTAVESTRASANIVPDSLAPDTTLMVGDRVAAPEPSAPKPEAPVPAPAPTPAPEKSASPDDPFAAPASPAAPASSDPFGN
ncbi:MAG: hypothetical protein V4733_07995 [Verrucomicrobiota bacterium]